MAKRININKPFKKGIVEFVRLLRVQGINVKKAILFGSYARGKNTPDSDIDVAVVSPQFGKDNLKEMFFLRKIALQVNSHIEPVPFSPSDITDRYSTLAQEIKKYGINIDIKPS
jgi:predicted nucleotidyltransferase